MLTDLYAPIQFEPTIETGVMVDGLFVLSITEYGREIRNAMRGLWQRVLTPEDFYNSMSGNIRRNITRAWQRGAAEYGIKMDELSQDERAALQSAIIYEHQWITGFADAIVQARAAADVSPAAKRRKKDAIPVIPGFLFARSDIWIGRYEGVRSKARAMAAGDQKLKWDRGATKDACTSCLKLHGKIKRASWWLSSGILPRVHGAHYLICKGFRCLCQLIPTNDPMSRGRMPRMP